MDTVLDLTKDNIQQVVDASMKQVIVLTFWSQQNPDSVALSQTLKQMAASEYGRFSLAKVNCDAEMEIANYFQIQALPTTLVLREGKPVDGFAGMKEAAEIQALLEPHLPQLWEMHLAEAKVLLANDNAEQALPLLKEAYHENQQAEVALVYADALLSLGQLEQTRVLLDGIGLADQDGYYQSLQAKLSLAVDAADTPEIRNLQMDVENNPDDFALLISLCKAFNSAKRDEEALEKLYAVLVKDINAHNGEVKQLFMEILTAMGQGNPVANQYRRRLYSLLY